MRKEQKLKEDDEKRKRGELPSSDKPVLTKDEVFKIWEMTLANVPDQYDFIIRTYNDG